MFHPYYQFQIGHSGDWQKAARLLSALMWQSLGRIWNGYEVRGFEKLPREEHAPAMLVYYHGEIPIDCYYLLSELVSSSEKLASSIPGTKDFQMYFLKISTPVFMFVDNKRTG